MWKKTTKMEIKALNPFSTGTHFYINSAYYLSSLYRFTNSRGELKQYRLWPLLLRGDINRDP